MCIRDRVTGAGAGAQQGAGAGLQRRTGAQRGAGAGLQQRFANGIRAGLQQVNKGLRAGLQQRTGVALQQRLKSWASTAVFAEKTMATAAKASKMRFIGSLLV